jgi:hypothetical protein
VSMVSAKSPFSLVEAEVRALCGEAAFAQGDRLQRSGSVSEAAYDGSALCATVSGTWRRSDQLTVSKHMGRLASTCSCGADGFCRHAAALLLHWVRDRASFTIVRRSGEAPADPPRAAEESPLAELERWLNNETLPQLREMARRRRTGIAARSKADLVGRLAVALAAPENIDEALAELDAEARLALDAAHVVGAVAPAKAARIADAYRALGGSSPPPLDRLIDLGLLVTESLSIYTPSGYSVPSVVGARLPIMADLIGRANKRSLEGCQQLPNEEGGSCLSVEELLCLVAREVHRSGVQRREPSAGERESAQLAPTGWEIDPAERLKDAPVSTMLARDREMISMAPSDYLLARADAKRLAARIGLSEERVVFAVHLLVGLGVIGADSHLHLNEDRLQEVLGLERPAKLTALARAWLAQNDWAELALIFGKKRWFQFLATLDHYYVQFPFLLAQALMARRLLARLVGRLAPDVWYDFASLVSQVAQLSPDNLPVQSNERWRLVEGDPTVAGERTERPVDDAALRAGLATAIISGPLSWLGMVDVASAKGRPVAFRVRPAAATLVGREYAEQSDPPSTTLTVGDDLTVVMRAGGSDAAALQLLDHAGALVGASADGIAYHLTAKRMQRLFDDGVDGPRFVRFLAERSTTALPEGARATLERWWADYGSVRLYDDITLLELEDDFVLPELLATTSLRSSLVHTFSPRLIAVDPAAVDDLVAELARLGHAPRVVEGA